MPPSDFSSNATCFDFMAANPFYQTSAMGMCPPQMPPMPAFPMPTAAYPAPPPAPTAGKRGSISAGNRTRGTAPRRRHRSGSGPTPVKSLSQEESDLLKLQRNLLESLLNECRSADDETGLDYPESDDEDNEKNDSSDKESDKENDKPDGVVSNTCISSGDSNSGNTSNKREREESDASSSFEYDLRVDINDDGHHELRRVKRAKKETSKDEDSEKR